LTNSIIFQDGYCTTNQMGFNHHWRMYFVSIAAMVWCFTRYLSFKMFPRKMGWYPILLTTRWEVDGISFWLPVVRF
jgi:hypothetical protein